MTVQYRITRILSTLLIAGLCSAPLLRAQQTNPSTPQQAPETSQQPQQPTDRDAASANRSGAARQCARASGRPGAEHTARSPGKPESAAAAGVAGNQREPIASAARARNHVS